MSKLTTEQQWLRNACRHELLQAQQRARTSRVRQQRLPASYNQCSDLLAKGLEGCASLWQTMLDEIAKHDDEAKPEGEAAP